MMTPIASLPISPSSLVQTADSLADRLKSGSAHSIGKVAKDFESMFVSLVLKEMRQTLGPGSLFGTDEADINGGLFDMFMGQHLVDAGGFGVARMMEKAVARQQDIGAS